jgi:hypothetical protein
MQRNKKRLYFITSFILLAISLSSLIGIGLQLNVVQYWLSRASGQPANIVVDTKGVVGPMHRSWANLAQGGESHVYSFAPVAQKVAALNPEYIRLDHIYDFNEVVSRSGDGSLAYSWVKLDRLIAEIQSVGAKPYISLTYMPPALNNGDLTGLPYRWEEWQQLVQKTIEHISGRSGLNISDVYYEVWNEPDLFGQFKTYGPKNYLDLYYYSAKGAEQARNTQSFKLGGPATTKLYKNWVTSFMKFVSANNLQLDFYSWHRYSYNPQDYMDDIESFDQWMRSFPQYALKLERHVTEWGPNSDLSAHNDGALAAAHTVAVTAAQNNHIDRAFTFEVQDGLDPQGKAYWGRWGLLTHNQFGSVAKPRYYALQLLNQLGQDQLNVVGEGSWVKAMSAKGLNGTIQVLLTNYDRLGRNTETVPVTFQRLDQGQYELTKTYLGRKSQIEIIDIATPQYGLEVPMPPNSVVLLELRRFAQ